ncbi:MAG TPA: hypothetical protein PLC13_06565, partial [Bacillota bacterium]|nr:hypothetical protein [Bacillota bacterium]
GNISIVAQKGAPTETLNALGSDYDITSYYDHISVEAKIADGDFDAAIVSTNTAAQLYEKTDGNVIAVSPVVMGDLYIVSNGISIPDDGISFLRGKTIIGCCEGGTGEYALKKLLEDNYINTEYGISFEWVSRPQDVKEALKEPYTVALLQEPYASEAAKSIKNAEKAVELDKLWEETYNSHIPTDVLVVSRSFAEKREKDLKIFLAEYEDSLDKAIENTKSKLVLYARSNRGEMLIKNYINVMEEFDLESLGGKAPKSDFYYGI